MSNNAKIVWLRVLHSVICLMIAVVGPMLTMTFLANLNFLSIEHNYHGGDGAGLQAIGFLIVMVVYIICCINALLLSHLLDHFFNHLSITITILMFFASAIPFVFVLLDNYSLTCDYAKRSYLLCISYATMTPLYWFVSWVFKRLINKLKINN